MRISHETLNPNGDPALNRRCSEFNMNDYHYGYVKREWPLGSDNDPKLTRMTAGDYEKWFANALSAFDRALSDVPFPTRKTAGVDVSGCVPNVPMHTSSREELYAMLKFDKVIMSAPGSIDSVTVAFPVDV